MSQILGGWSVGNLIEIRSGAPFSIASIAKTCNCFSQGNQGVDIIANPARLTGGFDPAKDVWFNTGAFKFSDPFRFGNEGKGIIEGLGFATVDTTVDKFFPVTERFKLEFRGELFNMLDRANFNNAGNSLGSTTFGWVTSAQDPRRIQLGLKLHF